MARNPVAVLVLPSLVALAAGCGGDPAQNREVASMRATLDIAQKEINELTARLERVEKQHALVEEKLAGLTVTAASRPAGVRPSNVASGEEAEGEENGTPEAPAFTSGEAVAVAEFLETAQGREKVAAIMEAERKKRDEEQRKARTEDMRKRVHDAIYGDLGAELNLTEDQKATVERVANDSIEKSMALFDQMRDGTGDRDLIREEFQRIRTAGEDELRAALTVEQFDKLQSERGRLMGFGGAGGGFGGRGGGRGGDAGGGGR